jgi:glycosyltransferase 2 family protein
MADDPLLSIPTLSVTPTWSRWIGRSVVSLTVIMALYLGATVWAARGDLMRAFGQLPLGALPSVIGLVFLGLGLRAMRWQYYVHRLQWQVSRRHSLAAFLASFAFTATPGKVGEAVKSVLLRTRFNVSLAEGLGVLMVERLGDLLAVLILAIGGLALLADAIVYFVIAAFLVGGMTLFVSCRPIYAFVLSLAARIPKLSPVAGKVLHLLDTSRALLRPTPFLIGVGIATVAWGCEGWAFHILARSYGVETSFLTSCSIYGVATLVGALSMMPGGLGSFEVVMVLLLKQLGTPADSATLLVVLFRSCSLWLGSLVGLAFLLGWLAFVSPAGVHSTSGDSP